MQAMSEFLPLAEVVHTHMHGTHARAADAHGGQQASACTTLNNYIHIIEIGM